LAEIRALIGSFLHCRGYELFQAKNGNEAIETAVAENPNLIFVDLRLRDMDGVEVGRLYRNFRVTGHVTLVGWLSIRQS
jgi:DNA-binding response OmpR family regulator